MVKLDKQAFAANAANEVIAHLKKSLAQAEAELQSLKSSYEEEHISRKQLENDLYASQKLFQLVIDTLPEAIFWKNKKSVYLGCNQNFAEDAGVNTPASIVGKTDYDLAWKEEEAQFFRECDHQVMSNDRAEFGIEEPQLQGDGKQAWLETNKAPLHDSDGQVIGILGTYQDITARKKLEIERQELNQELLQKTSDLQAALTQLQQYKSNLEELVDIRTTELKTALQELQQTQKQMIQSEKMSSLGKLVAGVAHEINNPINFIHGNLRYIQDYIENLLSLITLYQRHYPDPTAEIQDEIERVELPFILDDAPQILSSVKMGTQRIKNIVLSLRNFSRLDESGCKAVDIHEGIDSALLILQHHFHKQVGRPEIQIIKEYGVLPLVECYAGQLNQVFMSILTNAIDAIEDVYLQPTKRQRSEKSGKITIQTSTPDSQWIKIVISDNGSGLSDDTKQRIFDPFFTTKPIGKGTGMSLSISYKIITEQHRGRLDCDSHPAQGTSFIILIPVYQSDLVHEFFLEGSKSGKGE